MLLLPMTMCDDPFIYFLHFKNVCHVSHIIMYFIMKKTETLNRTGKFARCRKVSVRDSGILNKIFREDLLDKILFE